MENDQRQSSAQKSSFDKVVYSDLDGTITVKDTYTRYIFRYGNLVWLMASLPYLLWLVTLYSFKIVSRNEMKKETIKIFLKGKSSKLLEQLSKDFLPSVRFYDSVLAKLDTYKKDGYKIILVTASPSLYVKYLSKKLGYDGFIATELEERFGLLTGNVIGDNNNFEEKVKRIKNSPYYKEGQTIVSFGNSKGDYPMLDMADEYYYVDSKGNMLHNSRL
jgi:phosphatidylglycerophosphatase C